MENSVRVWDADNNIMRYDGFSLTYGANNTITINVLINKINGKIMHSVGRLDKNKKPIFEGDIVKVTGRKRIGEYITEVIFHRQMFCLKRNDTYVIDSSSIIGCEVIGNIYQNPELLV